MTRLLGWLLVTGLVLAAGAASAYDGIVEKKTFVLPSYTTVNGRTIKDVKVGYETYGTLNAARDNVIVIGHFYSGNSHAAGKYSAADAAPGYWDAIVDTGKPYGMTFPIVTIRDFVNVQKALVSSLGITKLHAVMGASMGALQTWEWAAAYPDMVARIVPVIGAAEIGPYAIEWLNIWGAPILLDPRWNKGDYYGKDEPTDGLALALKMVTIHARHFGWASTTFGRRWALQDRDPAKSWDNKYAVEDAIDKAAAARARSADANSFLYLAKANLFVVGHKGTLEDGLKGVRAKALVIPATSDLLLFPEYSRQAVELLKQDGKTVEYAEIPGDGGHLDGVLAVAKQGSAIREFLRR